MDINDIPLEQLPFVALRDVKGISNAEMDALYTLGYKYYQAGSFDKAETIFKAMVVLEPLNVKYHMSLAGAYQAQHEWLKALEQYGIVVGGLDIRNATASERAADCFRALGNKEAEKSAREHAAMFSKKQPKKEAAHE